MMVTDRTVQQKKIYEFVEYLDNEISPVITELENLEASNRIHLQKLVYVDAANRFDTLLDGLLIIFALDRDSSLQGKLLDTLNIPATQKDIFNLLLSDNPQDRVLERIKETAKSEFLRMSHAQKLRRLLRECYDWKDVDLDRSKVNPSLGTISKNFVQKNTAIPTNVVGYADWLYRRRNVLVHPTSGRSFSKQDLRELRRYCANPTSSINISLASVKQISVFYKNLCNKIL